MEPVAEPPVLDVLGLPNVTFRSHSLIWWGNVLYMLIEGAMFAMVIASYFYLRARVTDWPPGVNPPYLGWGIANGILFLVSLAPARWVRPAASIACDLIRELRNFANDRHREKTAP
jgi:cytochrome c oxidase subunit III